MFIAFNNNKLVFKYNKNRKPIYLVYDDGITSYLSLSKVLNFIKVGKIDNVYYDGNNLSFKPLSFRLMDVTEKNFIDLKKFDYKLSLTIKDFDEGYDYWFGDYEEKTFYKPIKDKRLFKRMKFSSSQEIINNYKILYYGNSIVGLIKFTNYDNAYYDFDIYYLIDIFDKMDVITFILQSNDKFIYIDSSSKVYEKYQDYNWKLLDFKSTLYPNVDKWNQFKYSNCIGSSNYYTYYNEKIIVNYIENKYKQKLDYSKLKVCSYDSLKDSDISKYYAKQLHSYKFILWETIGNYQARIIGFKYLNFDDLSSDFGFVFLTYNDIIIGVLKYKNYDTYIGIAFFEINQFYKTIELENYFIKLLNDYIPKNKIVQLPMDDESEKKSHLSERMKQYITVTQVKTDDDLRKERGY